MENVAQGPSQLSVLDDDFRTVSEHLLNWVEWILTLDNNAVIDAAAVSVGIRYYASITVATTTTSLSTAYYPR
jgi:hypothetical protein